MLTTLKRLFPPSTAIAGLYLEQHFCAKKCLDPPETHTHTHNYRRKGTVGSLKRRLGSRWETHLQMRYKTKLTDLWVRICFRSSPRPVESTFGEFDTLTNATVVLCCSPQPLSTYRTFSVARPFGIFPPQHGQMKTGSRVVCEFFFAEKKFLSTTKASFCLALHSTLLSFSRPQKQYSCHG